MYLLSVTAVSLFIFYFIISSFTSGESKFLSWF